MCVYLFSLSLLSLLLSPATSFATQCLVFVTSWPVKRALSGKVGAKLCIATHAHVWLYVGCIYYVVAICSCTKYTEYFTDSTFKEIIVSDEEIN